MTLSCCGSLANTDDFLDLSPPLNIAGCRLRFAAVHNGSSFSPVKGQDDRQFHFSFRSFTDCFCFLSDSSRFHWSLFHAFWLRINVVLLAPLVRYKVVILDWRSHRIVFFFSFFPLGRRKKWKTLEC